MRLAALLALCALAAPPARAADTASIESVVKAVYETISGPAGPRDWVRFRALFAEGARLIPMRPSAQGPSAVVMTPEEYAQRTSPVFEKSAFYEAPVAQRVESFGAIAHVFSTYESRRAPGEKPFARGINSFQLVQQGGAWKIMTILWDTEREGNPLPEKYLK
ncbi:MAG: hypothetical protein JST11_28345 [Acidobacteria bacterium]|nr:hypothetical protein [Acidobacteriota bacterium]